MVSKEDKGDERRTREKEENILHHVLSIRLQVLLLLFWIQGGMGMTEGDKDKKDTKEECSA